MKIENIKKMKNGKYKIEFDNQDKMVTYDDVILKNNLLYHQKLAEEELNQIQKDTAEYDIYYKCLKLISRRIRSEKEIKDYIYKITQEERKDVIQKLKEQGLINDTMFTSAFVYDKMNLSNEGPLKIKKELLEHNIEEEVIDLELQKYPEEVIDEKLNGLMKKKLRGNIKYSKYILKQKLFFYFSNLGYEKEKIDLFFEENYIVSNDTILREYQKIKRNLEKKYPGEDINFRIYQKLYQKGFQKEEIDKLLQEKM